MKIFLLCAALLCLGACSHTLYESGMHRQDIYEQLDRTQLGPFVMESRLDARHDVLVIPQAGFQNVYDDTVFDAHRKNFGRFRPTETTAKERGELLRAFAEVELWHALLLRDQKVLERLFDEDRERLIQRVELWMFENIDQEFDAARLDGLRLSP